ncbi:MAG: PPOX class F420-dependent enzyme [Gammaproteobacteria bacterium]|nr:PPOX class F420-dependent enzyme [Gammaproteobacteria bacterium]
MQISQSLSQAPYVSLATFRRSGVAVPTAVWCAEEAGDYFIFSAGAAGKVKRLRNSDRARLAVCDVRGRLLGEWHDALATVISEPQEVARALAALRRKYGFQMRVADIGARLTGRFNKRAYIRVRLVENAS